jgi:hypothetical protein
MVRDHIADRSTEEWHELVGTGHDFAARRGGVDRHVVGEHFAHSGPILGVHRAEVPRLELLDRLDVIHGSTSSWVADAKLASGKSCASVACRNASYAARSAASAAKRSRRTRARRDA